MEAARKGVDQGYEEAFNILEGLGAFRIEGIQAGVEQTKILLGEKLDQLEEKL
jgi:hypothetical protein